MRGFQAGTFRRENMGSWLRRLSPAHATLSILDIDPAELAEMGKKLVLIDVDNTIVPWRSEDIPETSREWLKAVRSAGLDVCILSNTRNPDRLNRLASQLGVRVARGKFKPSRAMYMNALDDAGVDADEAVMIGDQLFTDVLGANRSGIDSIWVRQMTPNDFVGTKLSRMGERFARRALYRHLHLAETRVAEEIEAEVPASGYGILELAGHPVVRQFLKFCVVGGLSFAIDYCVRMTLMFGISVEGGRLSDLIGARIESWAPGIFATHGEPSRAFFPVAAFCGAAFGMANSFVWNRRWTFRIRGKEERLAQLRRFLLVSMTGLALNVVLSSAFHALIPGDEKMSARIATVLAAGAVAFWNFAGQKFFAFRQRA